MNQEIENQIRILAYKRTTPFCMSCYHDAPSGRCSTCGSDDLARHLKGVAVDWSIDFAVEHLLSENLTPVDLDEAYEQFMSEVYPETTLVGHMEFDTVRIMKEMDPIGWRCGQGEWEDQQASEGHIISFDNGSTYYQRSDIEIFLEENAS